MVFDSRYNLNDTVYLRTDESQCRRLVVYIRFESGGSIMYGLACAEGVTIHYEAEISDEMDQNLKLNL